MLIPFGLSLMSFGYLGPFWTLAFTTLALLLSASIQSLSDSISFYNAILVIYLCYLHCFSSLFVLNILCWVHQKKKMDDNLSILTASQCMILFVFLVLLFLAERSFGSQPECNSGVYLTPFLYFCHWLTFDSSSCRLTF